MNVDLRCGDSFDLLKTLDDNSVDTVITDPPAGISFMGKDWDGDKGGRDAWIAWLSAILTECYRVAKPGAMLLCWALPRTSHWTGTAIENAGWEVRDVISHLFGSGFPKSLDISKALDKAAGAERTEKIWADRFHDGGNRGVTLRREFEGDFQSGVNGNEITLPATPAAREWDGYGTALKPACEFWWLAMKPLEGTFAQNALKWGVAGLNVDAARIGTQEDLTRDCLGLASAAHEGWKRPWNENAEKKKWGSTNGRFPSHVVLSHSPNCNGSCADDCPVRILDEQAGERKSGWKDSDKERTSKTTFCSPANGKVGGLHYSDTGGASRFFYVAKASRRERDAGLEGMPEQRFEVANHGMKKELWEDGTLRERKTEPAKARNHHPTVKPLTLMEYLCNLTRTPTGGLVLDPFMGSGSTIVAAIRTGRSVIGFEAKQEYYEIAVARAKHAQQGQPALL